MGLVKKVAQRSLTRVWSGRESGPRYEGPQVTFDIAHVAAQLVGCTAPSAVARVHVARASSRGQCSLAGDRVGTPGRGENFFFFFITLTFRKLPPGKSPPHCPPHAGQAVKQAARDGSESRWGKGGESCGCWALELVGSTTSGLSPLPERPSTVGRSWLTGPGSCKELLQP